MIDDKLLLGLLIGSLPSLFTLINQIINGRVTREGAFIAALQAEIKALREENTLLKGELAGWRREWNETYQAARLSLQAHLTQEADPS